MSEAVFVLIHSPLVGPMIWEPVAERLVREGHDVLVPRLSPPAGVRRPYSLQYALEVAGAASLVPPGKPIVLVGHSNAGQRLASFRQEIAAPVAAYVLVDSALPERTLSEEGRSYLEQRRRQAVEGMIEPWTEEELAPALPDPVLRRRFMAELTAWPLAFFEEEIPVFVGWPDAACAYIRFTATPSRRNRARDPGGLAADRVRRRRPLPHARGPRSRRRFPAGGQPAALNLEVLRRGLTRTGPR